jgi:hypothetical protein
MNSMNIWDSNTKKSENFMKNQGKVIRNAKTERREWKYEFNKFLRNHRSSPHLTTGKAPSILIFNRNNTSSLPRSGEVESQPEAVSRTIRDRDQQMKQNAKIYADKRRQERTVIFDLGDEVFAKQKRTDELKTRFGLKVYKVTSINGSMITVRPSEVKGFTTDRSYFKKKYCSMESEDIGTTDESDDYEVFESHTSSSESHTQLNIPIANKDKQNTTCKGRTSLSAKKTQITSAVPKWQQVEQREGWLLCRNNYATIQQLFNPTININIFRSFILSLGFSPTDIISL